MARRKRGFHTPYPDPAGLYVRYPNSATASRCGGPPRYPLHSIDWYRRRELYWRAEGEGEDDPRVRS